MNKKETLKTIVTICEAFAVFGITFVIGMLLAVLSLI